jgi:hypothetical protein
VKDSRVACFLSCALALRFPDWLSDRHAKSAEMRFILGARSNFAERVTHQRLKDAPSFSFKAFR